jgi:hypothetical protein
MEAASRDFCESGIRFGKKSVVLPMLFYWFKTDFLRDEEEERGKEKEKEGEDDGGKEGGVGEGDAEGGEADVDGKVDEKIGPIYLSDDEGKKEEREGVEGGPGGGKGPVESHLLTIRWLTKRQKARRDKMVREGNFRIAYEYDWTPSLM